MRRSGRATRLASWAEGNLEVFSREGNHPSECPASIAYVGRRLIGAALTNGMGVEAA